MNPYHKYLSLTLILALFGFVSLYAQGQQPLIDLNSASLSERWLIKNDSIKSFKIVPYKPVYLLALNLSLIHI